MGIGAPFEKHVEPLISSQADKHAANASTKMKNQSGDIQLYNTSLSLSWMNLVILNPRSIYNMQDRMFS